MTWLQKMPKNQEKYLLKYRKRINWSQYANLGTKRLVAMESKCHKINISIKLWVWYKKIIFEAGMSVYYLEWSVFRSGQDFNHSPKSSGMQCS